MSHGDNIKITCPIEVVKSNFDDRASVTRLTTKVRMLGIFNPHGKFDFEIMVALRQKSVVYAMIIL